MDEKEVGKYCTKAKRMFTTAKTKRVKIDELSKLEGTVLGADEKLAQLVYEKEQKEQEIIKHIDLELDKSRDSKYRHLDVFSILNMALHELVTTNGLYASDNPEFKESFQLDNSKVIELIKQVV